MWSIALGLAGALLAKGQKENDVLKEVARRADLLDKEYYTTEEVAKISGLSDYTVRKKIREGELRAEGEGTRSGYRIRKEDLLEFLFKHRTFTRNYEKAAKTWSEKEFATRISALRTVGLGIGAAYALGKVAGKSFGAAAAGAALVGIMAANKTPTVPIIEISPGALFTSKEEYSDKEIDAMVQLVANVRLLRQYINMKEKLLEQLKLEEEELQISYKGKLEDDEYRLKEIEQKKKINDAELELELLQSQLEELEKHTKK
jgi:DNA binding domain, excisionase family